MANNSRESIREFIVGCMWGLVHQMTQNIKSGWSIIFSIFKLAAQDSKFSIVEIAFNGMEKVIKNDYVFIEDNIIEVVACLFKFIENQFLNFATSSIDLLEICALNMTKKESLEERKGENPKHKDSNENWFCVLQGLANRSWDKED